MPCQLKVIVQVSEAWVLERPRELEKFQGPAHPLLQYHYTTNQPTYHSYLEPSCQHWV